MLVQIPKPKPAKSIESQASPISGQSRLPNRGLPQTCRCAAERVFSAFDWPDGLGLFLHGFARRYTEAPEVERFHGLTIWALVVDSRAQIWGLTVSGSGF